jgi:hypothetical protein
MSCKGDSRLKLLAAPLISHECEATEEISKVLGTDEVTVHILLLLLNVVTTPLAKA